MLLETAMELGPARVLEVTGARLRLSMRDREVAAILATPFPYQPAPGDVVLAIGQEEAYYVIGVLEGKGKTVFTSPGPLEFRAPQGPIRFVSPQGIHLRGGRVDVRAGEINVVAETQTENLGESYRRVRDVDQLKAGEVRHVSEGEYKVKAERIVEVAEKNVSIDGARIDLG